MDGQAVSQAGGINHSQIDKTAPDALVARRRLPSTIWWRVRVEEILWVEHCTFKLQRYAATGVCPCRLDCMWRHLTSSTSASINGSQLWK
jgi:hypothetical protein